jgi:hypothetical protein
MLARLVRASVAYAPREAVSALVRAFELPVRTKMAVRTKMIRELRLDWSWGSMMRAIPTAYRPLHYGNIAKMIANPQHA